MLLALKAAFVRGLKKKDIGATNIDDIIELMKENISDTTEKFEKFAIQKTEFLSPPDQKETEKKAEPLEGILKFHSIFINSDGQLRGSELSCLYCSVK